MKNNWPIKKLSEVIGKIESGRRPKGGGSNSVGIASVGVENLTYDNHFNFSKIKQIPNEFFGSLKQGKIQSNDILVAKDGATTGKVVLVDKKFPYKSAAVNEHIFILRTKPEEMIQNYLFPFLFSAEGQRQIKLSIHGAAQGGIDKSFINDISIPVPPLKIQQKIVERLDAIRKAQELNDLQISRTQELFESILNSELSKISIKKQLSELCKIIGGGTPSRKIKENFEGKIPWVTVKDMSGIEIFDTKEHVNDLAIKNSAANLVPSGTVLVVTRVGLGKIAICRKKVCFNQDIKALIPKVELNPEYLLFAMKKRSDQIISYGTGATVQGITLETLNNIVIPYPNVADQQKIVEKLNAVQDYKKSLLDQKSLLRELFDSVLHKSMN